MTTITDHLAESKANEARDAARKAERELSAKGDKLMADFKAYLTLEEHLKAAGVTMPEQLFDRRQELQAAIEALPIHADGISGRRWYGFIYSSGEWWPASVVNGSRKAGWIEYRIDYDDGSSESGPVPPFEWAHCTADNTPNFHWLDRDEDEEIFLKRFAAAKEA